MRSILFFTLFFVFSSAQASQPCESVLPLLFPEGVRVNYESAEVQAQTEKTIKKIIQDSEQISKGHFILPSHLEIRVAKTSKFPDELNGKISVGRRIEISDGIFSKDRYFKTLLSHEYAHAILHENLSRSPALAEFFNSAELGYNKQAAFKQYFRAYDELFADFYAAIQSKDPQIAQKTLTSKFQTREAKQSKALRSFIKHYKLEGWDYESPYGMLAPSRSIAWKLAQTHRRELNKNPGRTIARMISAIRDQTEKRVANLEAIGFPQPDLLETSEIEKINRDFIDSLRKAFSH